ncbi:2-phospho-L-lactate transferase CofD family protein [Aeromicrobium sp. A1-2]|uniref:2-phospho-L-lactate transferase CofD family protein n=1 Tax=Aeromicrobium sp. A1-2 TaxID=2107713 RepID=UPI0013C3463F|nr:2-phospho-L-lactate transferase CofD family protein [Aeromicrobium sp. A1-2]
MRITVILGADGAPFAHDLTSHLEPGDELVVIAPTMLDRWATGLKVCPDLDALLVARASSVTHEVADELIAIGYAPAWQRPSDAVVAAQLVRTDLLGAGYSLTEATSAIAARRDLGFTLLPASDDRAELHAVVESPEGQRAIHLSEVIADPSAHEVKELVLVAETWSVSDAVRAAIGTSDVLVLGPSSRTLAIDPVLRAPGLRESIDDDLPVLIVEHNETAPPTLVQIAGMREPDPGRAEPVTADAATVAIAARAVVR